MYIYALKSANSATFPLTPPLTLYLSNTYAMYKYTRAKKLPTTEYNTTYIVSYLSSTRDPKLRPEHKTLNKD